MVEITEEELDTLIMSVVECNREVAVATLNKILERKDKKELDEYNSNATL